MWKKIMLLSLLTLLLLNITSFAQDRVVLVPKKVSNSPYVIDDSQDLFGKAWRFYRDGFTDMAADSLKKLIELFGYNLKKNNYYIVVHVCTH